MSNYCAHTTSWLWKHKASSSLVNFSIYELSKSESLNGVPKRGIFVFFNIENFFLESSNRYTRNSSLNCKATFLHKVRDTNCCVCFACQSLRSCFPPLPPHQLRIRSLGFHSRLWKWNYCYSVFYFLDHLEEWTVPVLVNMRNI